MNNITHFINTNLDHNNSCRHQKCFIALKNYPLRIRLNAMNRQSKQTDVLILSDILSDIFICSFLAAQNLPNMVFHNHKINKKN